MKKIKYIISLIVAVFLFEVEVSALTYGGCEYSVISKLKSFVSNINLKYDYYIENNKAYFNLTVTNLTPELYFRESNSNKNYYYNDSKDGELIIYGISAVKGYLKFHSARSECHGVSLGSKYYNFPVYNKYFTDPLCIQNPTYSICKKWANINYSYSEFKEAIERYREKKEDKPEIIVNYEKSWLDEIIEFYVNNYYIILPIIIVFSSVVIIINRRNNKFRL